MPSDRPPDLPSLDRIETLDGVRGIAILLVVAMHSLFLGLPLRGAERLAPDHPYALLAGLGWCGVDVFFVLSGFLITRILLRSRGAPHYFRNFYLRRSLRIFPLYYAMLVLLFWVLRRPPASPETQAAYFLYYQNFVLALGGDNVDVARTITWSLAIEEQFYLVWPALVFLVPARRLAAFCSAVVVAAILLRFLFVELGTFTHDGFVLTHFVTPCRMDALAAGALLAAVPLPPAWLGRVAAVLGGGALVAIAFATANAVPYEPTFQRFGLVAALVMSVGLCVLARHGGAFARLCGLGALRSLGRYSYCVYLVHFLVVERLALWCYGDPAAPPAPWQTWLLANVPQTLLLVGFLALCLVASWLVAFTSWHLFEKWFLALKRHFPSAGGTPQGSGL